MYTKPISRKDPGCIVFLLDRSDSMGSLWGSSGWTLAEGATKAVNDIIFELCLRSQVEPGKARYYFDIGIFGYGVRAHTLEQGVESAFEGVLAGQPMVSLPELRNNPIDKYEVPSADGGGQVRTPMWVRPRHGEQTPMCEAIAVAGGHVYDWAASHPASFPPIVINITDGMVTDEPYQGATLVEWAQRLTSIQTNDGQVLLFNIFLSPHESAQRELFPATAKKLPNPGPTLFKISSELPLPMAKSAQVAGVGLEHGAKGLGFNADAQMLIKFLEIGTRLETRD